MMRVHLSFAVIAILAAPALAQSVELDQSHVFGLDEDGDGAVSRTEYDAFTDFAFETIDTDRDGALSPDEVEDHLPQEGFRILDDDGNGSVSRAEFSAQMDEDFVAADKDGDGLLN